VRCVCANAWCTAVPHTTQGDYVARVSIRSDDVALLKKYQQVPLHLERSLKGKAEIPLTAYANIQVRHYQQSLLITCWLCSSMAYTLSILLHISDHKVTRPQLEAHTVL
jgi:Tripeptidyl peptidase II